jgi:hypothetical protein
MILDYYYMYNYIFLVHEYVESSLINVPHVHNIASRTVGEVYFETLKSLQLMNIMIHVSKGNCITCS